MCDVDIIFRVPTEAITDACDFSIFVWILYIYIYIKLLYIKSFAIVQFKHTLSAAKRQQQPASHLSVQPTRRE